MLSTLRMGQFLETDEFYRNQFETKTSCGAIDDGNETRIGWERALFGDTYEARVGGGHSRRCRVDSYIYIYVE